MKKDFETERKPALQAGLFSFILLFFMGCVSNNNQEYYRARTIYQTPFDNRYARVEKYLKKMPRKSFSEQNKKIVVEKYLKKASQFIYEEDKKQDGFVREVFIDYQRVKYDHWKLPHEIEMTNKGDCEDKAIWLYSKLIEKGFNDVRLVAGKHREPDKILHAWVTWHHENRVYILDPTKNKGIHQVNDYPSGYYKPYYFFHRGARWCGVIACGIEPSSGQKGKG